MKRLLLLLPLLCTAVAAQDPNALGMRVDTIVAGRDSVTGRALRAVRYSFDSSYVISGFDVRPDCDRAICQLSRLTPSGKYIQPYGKLVGWEMRTGAVRWAQDVRYPRIVARFNSVNFCGDILVQSDGVRNRCFDAATGELLSENRCRLYYLSDEGIALGYGKNRSCLKGIDLRTGRELWERELKCRGGSWNQVVAGDSAVLVSAEGLHWVDLYSGKGWSRPFRTYSNPLTASEIALSVLTCGFGLLFLNADAKFYLTSNLLFSTSMLSEPVLYQASCDSLFAFDRDGGVLWATPLPDRKSGVSRIYETDTTVVLVHKGLSDGVRGLIPYGAAYLAAFDKKNGRRMLFESLAENKGDAVYSSIPWTDDRLLLVGKKKIALYAKSGEQVAENSVENISGGEIQTIYHNGCDRFSPESGGFRPVVDREDEWAIRTDDGWLAVLDDNLSVKRQYVMDSLVGCFDRFGDMSILYHEGRTLLVGPDGKVRSSMMVGVPVFLDAPVLYCRDKNSLVKVDLSPSLGRDWNDPDPFEKAFVADNRWNH